ncbi:Metallo-hydrolase/oxidoreductase [Irpex rosettiformis]|uniref:Metallo-hydrolase/oxidoreductase n=1 Tax=Irpex rosettiformis TaxID=378272 RepID=A0ACB8U9A0_9APHY|nr:Metallo-hydrolase/oxidoreductase [Irpex rosettiformis]
MAAAVGTGLFRAITVSPPLHGIVKHEPGVKPAHHCGTNGCFTNPWPSFRERPRWNMFFSVLSNQIRNMPKVPDNISSLIPASTPNWGMGENVNSIKATWLGHACYLIELPTPAGATRGARIILDPALSHRCFSSEYLGPGRITPVPCKTEEIPEVDAIVLSHNHYDHTDTKSLQKLVKQHNAHVFAPLGNRPYLESCSIPHSNIHIFDWWESSQITVDLPSSAKSDSSSEGHNQSSTVQATFKVICTPCQHFSGRSANDRAKTLWASWAIEEILSSPSIPGSGDGEARAPKKIWFGGDTGYRTVFDGENEDDVPVCPAFKEIGEKIGPFDFAMIPIGAYDPRSLFSSVHASPKDSVAIFKDVKAKKALAMHWGTWILTTEPIMDPPRLLKEECHKSGVPEGDFDICGLGETRFF